MTASFACFASSGKVPPNVTPVSEVFTAPVIDRDCSGPSMFGLNVSMWLAPPPRNTITTARSFTHVGSIAAAFARVSSNHGSDNPPSASDPARRKLRRERPAQSRVAESV